MASGIKGLKRGVLECREAGALIVRNSDRASTLIEQFKRIAAGQDGQSRRSFELLALVQDCIAALRPRLGEIEIELRIPAGLKMESYPVSLEQIVTNLIVNSGGQWLGELAASGAQAVGLDWTTSLAAARAQVGEQVALQGNLDPAILFASEQQIRAQVRTTLDAYGRPAADGGHVFNLGHGISQHTRPEAVAAMVDEVHAHSRRQRAAG